MLIAYLMLIKIGEMLRQSDIHGVRAVAWASIALYNLSMIKQQNSFVWEIIDFCLMVGFIFAAIDGAIRLLVSFSYKLKELRSNSEIEVANLESVIAIVTALVAIGISFVEFLQ